jgi:sigma-E factor negative regulatory protein RseA
MSDQQREHLSALVDGEIDDALLRTTLSAVASSPGLSAAWERYHLIGLALRGESVRPGYREIAARVRERTDREPAPAVRTLRPSRRRSRLSPFAGAALAASAAFFAVFAVPQLFDPNPAPPGAPVAVMAADPSLQFKLADPGQRWHLDEPALQNKLDRFLVNHQAYSPSAGIKGFLPYATVVGYGAGR